MPAELADGLALALRNALSADHRGTRPNDLGSPLPGLACPGIRPMCASTIRQPRLRRTIVSGAGRVPCDSSVATGRIARQCRAGESVRGKHSPGAGDRHDRGVAKRSSAPAARGRLPSWHRHSRHDAAAVVEAIVPGHGLSAWGPAVGSQREAAVRCPTEAIARPVTSASRGPPRGSPGRCSRPPRAARRVALVRDECGCSTVDPVHAKGRRMIRRRKGRCEWCCWSSGAKAEAMQQSL